MTKVIQTVSEMQQITQELKRTGKTIGLFQRWEPYMKVI